MGVNSDPVILGPRCKVHSKADNYFKKHLGLAKLRVMTNFYPLNATFFNPIIKKSK